MLSLSKGQKGRSSFHLMKILTAQRVVILASLFWFAILPSAHGEEVLTWDDCLKAAARNNPDLVSAQESVTQARASQALTASGLFPQLTASASASGTQTRVDESNSTSQAYSFGLSGTQLLFDGFKTRYDVEAAKETTLAAQQSYRFSSATVRLNLRTAFIDLLKAQELVSVAQQILDIRKDQQEIITLRYESGLEHKGALLNTQASLAQAQFELGQAKRGLEVAQRQLIQQMGSSQFTPLKVSGLFEVTTDINDKPDFAALMQQHPTFQQAIAKKNAAQLGVKSADANYLPTVSLTAGAARNGSEFFPQDDRLSGGVTVSLPIFEGGSRKAQQVKAQSLLRQAQANEESTQNEIVFNLPQQWNDFIDAVGNVNVQKKLLDADEERSRIAEAQYSVGLTSYDDWTIIQDNLVQAKKTYLTAQANALLAEAQWVFAKGEVLEYAPQ